MPMTPFFCLRFSPLRRLWLSAAVVLLAGCQQKEATPAPTPAPAPAARQTLTIFAAASLRDAFGSLRDEFIRTHANLGVSFNFAGSQDLRTQIEHAAPADVFASADKKNMGELSQASKVGTPAVFARNEPVVVVAKESATSVSSFTDLPKVERVVLGGPDVPIGRYTGQILDNASKSLAKDFRQRVEAHVVSHELDVRQVLNKVVLGEANAGVVYRTDANSAKDKVSIVTIPPELNVIAEYPIAVVSGSPHAELAAEWVKFVLSPAGQALLQKAGFIAPAGPPPT
jgi:molybdate transport system substrate-binding protein